MADTQRSAYERVQLARSKDRPNIQDYIDHLAVLPCWGTVR